METNERIALWAGWKPKFYHGKNGKEQINVRPDYEHSDSAAVTLLPVLVERGYNVSLSDYYRHSWFLVINCDEFYVQSPECPTIAAAITSAICQLIDTEKGGGYGESL